MVVLKRKEDKISMDEYYLDTDGVSVFSVVVIHSLLNSQSERQKIAQMLSNNSITQFYHDELINNMHEGQVNSTTHKTDPSISQEYLDSQEMVDFMENSSLLPFGGDATIIEAIQAVSNLGYRLVRKTKNNL